MRDLNRYCVTAGHLPKTEYLSRFMSLFLFQRPSLNTQSLQSTCRNEHVRVSEFARSKLKSQNGSDYKLGLLSEILVMQSHQFADLA